VRHSLRNNPVRNAVSMSWVVWMSLCLAAIVAPSVAWAQETHRDAGLGVTVTIPADWKVAPREVVEEANASIRQSMGAQAPVYAAALAPAEPDGSYALLQSLPWKGTPSYEEIERSLGMKLQDVDEKTRQAMGSLVREMSIGEGSLDRERGRFVFKTDVTAPDGTRVLGVSYGFLTANGSFMLHCYAPAAGFDARLASFESMADGVVVDAGSTFVAKKTGFDFSRTLVTAAIGGGLGLVAAVAAKLAKKK
jgi:hypothetical protein